MASQLEAAGTATMIDDDAAHVSVHDDAKAEEPLRGAVHDIVVADGHSSGSDDNDDYYAEYDEYSDHDNSHRGRHPGDDVEAQRGVPHLVTLPSATTTSLAGDRLAQGDLSDESLLDDLQSALDIVGVDRVMMGTDYPFDMQEFEPVAFVESATKLSAGERKKILGGTAAELMRIS